MVEASQIDSVFNALNAAGKAPYNLLRAKRNIAIGMTRAGNTAEFLRPTLFQPLQNSVSALVSPFVAQLSKPLCNEVAQLRVNEDALACV